MSFKQNLILSQWMMKSPFGSIYLVASEKGLRGVFVDEQNIPLLRDLKEKDARIEILAQAERELTEYFSGTRKKFNVAFDLEGTTFQLKVWQTLAEIPYGETRSYRDIAVKIKNENAVRAVGNANGKNPLCIIIPCHRVIAADGSIGGYSSGLPLKHKLLQLEGVRLLK